MTRPAMSTQQASRKAAEAADQVLHWLKQQGGLPDGSGEGQPEPGHAADGGAEAPSPNSPMQQVPENCQAFARDDAPQRLGDFPGQEPEVDLSLIRRAEWATREPAQGFAPAGAMAPAAAPLRPRHTDWLHHRLLVAGPAGLLADFQAAAGGTGTVPWRLDLDRMEEDLFLLLAAPPSPQRRRLSLAGARTLAGQLRTAAEQRRVAVVARVGQSCACPLDLHALVPVPDSVLQLGPDHAEALAWLWAHWGTTAALRHVAAGLVLPRRAAPGDPVTLDLAFWSADWTPWRALATVAARWPALRFHVRPTYGLL